MVGTARRVVRRARRSRPTEHKKPARELRQGGSYYRCCIPALAGFVSPQSIVPDGAETSANQRQRATRNLAQTRHHSAPGFGNGISMLTVDCASVCIERVKWPTWLLLICLLGGATSCTTLVNRRDLYSPEPAPDSLQAAQQWYGVRTTTTVTTQARPSRDVAPPPEFRY